MAINPFTGARLDQTFFDVTADGLFNNSDKLNVAGTLTVVSGVGLTAVPTRRSLWKTSCRSPWTTAPPRLCATQGSSVDSRRLTWREIRN